MSDKKYPNNGREMTKNDNKRTNNGKNGTNANMIDIYFQKEIY